MSRETYSSTKKKIIEEKKTAVKKTLDNFFCDLSKSEE